MQFLTFLVLVYVLRVQYLWPSVFVNAQTAQMPAK